MANVVIGVFSNRQMAEDAVMELEGRGYNPKDMSIIMKDMSETKRDTGAGDIVGGTVAGAATGIILGSLAGLVASFVIPGLGALFIGGPLAESLGLTGAAATTASGAATGAVAGGIIGALTEVFGLTSEEARVYEDRIRAGGILIAVPAGSNDVREVKDIMMDSNADNIRTVESLDQTERREKGQQAHTQEYAAAHFSEIGRKRRRTKVSRR